MRTFRRGFGTKPVRPGLVPGIHVLAILPQERRGWPGRRPAMTESGVMLTATKKNGAAGTSRPHRFSPGEGSGGQNLPVTPPSTGDLAQALRPSPVAPPVQTPAP